MNWVSDDSNKRIQDIREKFVAAMKETSKESFTTYYDFLLVAKQLGFRFEEAKHLMTLKNHFLKNHNQLDKRRLADLLMIHPSYSHVQKQDKVIVKFNLPDTQFDPIQEVTNEDEDYYGQDDKLEQSGVQSWKGTPRRRSESIIGKIKHVEEDEQYSQKINIIVSIKMEEMLKKLQIIRQCQNLFEIFDETKRGKINLIEFKKGLLRIFYESKEKLKITEDDIKTFFYILDNNKEGELTEHMLLYITQTDKIQQELKDFYRSRINPSLIKNTQVKKGKYKNQIQIFQVKNTSIFDLQQIEKAVISEESINEQRQEVKKGLLQSKKPHFGPLKHNTYNKKKNQHFTQMFNSNRQLRDGESSIWMQRQRIEKIIKLSKDRRKENNSNQTIASKLRSLFIHKVILPREKMIDQQKEADIKKFKKSKGLTNNNLSIRPVQK